MRPNDAHPGPGIAPPGFRLPAAARPGQVSLQVADLERSLAYYTTVLGMRVRERAAGRAVLGAAGGEGALVELVERRGARPVPRGGRPGLYHFALLLPERAALGRLLAHLAALGVRAGMSDHRVSEAVYLTDPDGLGIEVYADRPREGWRHEGGELVMTTEPLDVAAVVGAAGGAAWDGLPAGTVLGHVHLFVGDLAAADAFYHRGLGMDRMVWSYPGALFLAAGGYHHHLGTNTWAAGAAPAGADDARLLHWSLLLPSAAQVEAAARSLEAAGFGVRREGAGWEAADPWGTPLRVLPAG